MADQFPILRGVDGADAGGSAQAGGRKLAGEIRLVPAEGPFPGHRPGVHFTLQGFPH